MNRKILIIFISLHLILLNNVKLQLGRSTLKTVLIRDFEETKYIQKRFREIFHLVRQKTIMMSSDEQRKQEAAKVWCASLGEPSPEEQHDDALTSEYKGRSVRVDKVNGTVQNVKFGFAHVVLEDGTTANLKFEHLGKWLGHYRIWDSSTAEATASAALAVEAQAHERRGGEVDLARADLLAEAAGEGGAGGAAGG